MNLAVRVSRGTCWLMGGLPCYTVRYISALLEPEEKSLA